MIADLDLDVRAAVYDAAMTTGRVPRRAEVAAALGLEEAVVAESYARLYAARMLAAFDGEVLMAGPFSAVPTPFLVDTGAWRAWGNCIWDALGIPAMVHRDAVIDTSCGCCGEPATLRIENGSLVAREGIVHFALPPKQWWADIVFT